MKVGENITIQGVLVEGKGTNSTVTIQAGKDIHLDTLSTSSSRAIISDAKNIRKERSTVEIDSTMASKGAISMFGGQDILASIATNKKGLYSLGVGSTARNFDSRAISYYSGVSTSMYGTSLTLGNTWKIGNRYDDSIWDTPYDKKVYDYYEIHKDDGNIKLYVDKAGTPILIRRTQSGVQQYTGNSGATEFISIAGFDDFAYENYMQVHSIG